MKPLDALTRLRQQLDETGVSYEDDGRELRGRGEDWRRVWETFCELARQPADEPFERHGLRLRVGDDADNDLLLHESGGYGEVPFGVECRRQFSFEDDERDYAGMNGLWVSFECDRAPDGRVPQAQRWGYAGRRRDDVSEEAHAEMRNWAGWVDSWKRAVEASNSFKVLDEIQPVRWSAVQSDY
jgi:hypothetical protein